MWLGLEERQAMGHEGERGSKDDSLLHQNHFVVFEIASKYCISDSFVDHDGYSISFK